MSRRTGRRASARATPLRVQTADATCTMWDRPPLFRSPPSGSTRRSIRTATSWTCPRSSAPSVARRSKRMGSASSIAFVSGVAWFSRLTWEMARGKTFDPAANACAVCRRSAQTHGWCEEHGQGLVGGVVMRDRAACEGYRGPWRCRRDVGAVRGVRRGDGHGQAVSLPPHLVPGWAAGQDGERASEPKLMATMRAAPVQCPQVLLRLLTVTLQRPDVPPAPGPSLSVPALSFPHEPS